MLQGAKKLLSGSVLVVALQAVNFIALARILGPTDFGAAATANAFAAIALPLAGLGFGNVLLMKAARNTPNLAVIAGNALLANVASGLVLCAIATVTASAIISPLDDKLLQAFILILITELVLIRTATVAAQLYAARSRFGLASSVNVISSVVRLSAIGACIAYNDANLTGWSNWLFFLSLLYALLLGAAIRFEAKGLGFSLATMKADLGMGVSFSVGTLCKAVYTDGDKIFLAKFHEASSVGLYSSAYRLTSMSFMPVRALLDASAHRFFQEGGKGLSSALPVSWSVMRIALPYTLMVAIILYFGAPLLPLLLGSAYEGATAILQIIAILPLVQAIHYALSDALTGANMQATRTKAQLSVAVAYITAASFFIPMYGPLGAAVVCVASEGLLAIIIFSLIIFKRRKSVKAVNP